MAPTVDDLDGFASTTVEFNGIEERYERFWDEIPNPRFGPSDTR
jgi:hypothetical protein